MKAGAGKAKGNWFEGTVAKSLSQWMTGGEDKTQLIRSVMSGGSFALKADTAARPHYHVGDLAPNGPQGEWFRSKFGIECKNEAGNPDWWHVITSSAWITEAYWSKIKGECAPFNLAPLLIMQRNNRPMVVIMDTDLCTSVRVPQLIIPRLGAAVITMKEFQSHTPKEWWEAADRLYRLPQSFPERRYGGQEEVHKEEVHKEEVPIKIPKGVIQRYREETGRSTREEGHLSGD